MSILEKFFIAFGNFFKPQKKTGRSRPGVRGKKLSPRKTVPPKTAVSAKPARFSVKKKTAALRPGARAQRGGKGIKKPGNTGIPTGRKNASSADKSRANGFSSKETGVFKKRKVDVMLDSDPSKLAKVGVITHYFSKIMVCVVRVDRGLLQVGDQVRIKGKGTDFIQKISSLQVESLDVKSVKQGQLVGLKVNKEACVGAAVYRLK